MASPLRDEADWVEVYNPHDVLIELGDFYLSDDLRNLKKWQFPRETLLQPLSFLVVRASGQDSVDTAGTLHTNFRLDLAGEALVLTDGENVVSKLGSQNGWFPEQFPGISFGVKQELEVDPLVNGSTLGLVDVSFDADVNWINSDYVADPPWRTVDFPLGYDAHGRDGSAVGFGSEILKVDFQKSKYVGGREAAEPGWSLFEVGSDAVDEISDSFGEIKIGVRRNGTELIRGWSYDPVAILDNPPAFTLDHVLNGGLSLSSPGLGSGLDITIDGLRPSEFYELTFWSVDTTPRRTGISDWFDITSGEPRPIRVAYETPSRLAEIQADEQFTVKSIVQANQGGAIGVRVVNQSRTSKGPLLNGLQLRYPGFSGSIRSNLENELFGKQSSARIRIPFETTLDPQIMDSLILDIAYDAGFVAYLNGQQVIRRNAPGRDDELLPAGSVATGERRAELKLTDERINLSRFIPLLDRNQTNVLARHRSDARRT